MWPASTCVLMMSTHFINICTVNINFQQNSCCVYMVVLTCLWMHGVSSDCNGSEKCLLTCAGLVLTLWLPALTLYQCGWRLQPAGSACLSTSGRSLRHSFSRTENSTRVCCWSFCQLTCLCCSLCHWWNPSIFCFLYWNFGSTQVWLLYILCIFQRFCEQLE